MEGAAAQRISPSTAIRRSATSDAFAICEVKTASRNTGNVAYSYSGLRVVFLLGGFVANLVLNS